MLRRKVLQFTRLGIGLVALAALLAGAGADAAPVRLARHPDYHKGKIVFSYLGDLWLAREDGSNPRRLTVHKARDIHPRFSPDGKWIAFSSNRYGNYDVFVMPATGGKAKRLTYHSANDTVVGWSRDSRRVIFSSARGMLFPGISNLYEVPVSGGLEEPILTDWGYWGSYSPDGKKFAFNRHPMTWWRKHYRGSYAADLWVLDVRKNSFKKILDEKLPDEQKPNNFWPMYAEGTIYFVSDRDVMAKAGSKKLLASRNNIWKVPDEGGEPVQVTKHTSGSLFWPSMSSDGKTIVYEENFGLWKLDVESGKTTEIKIDITSDDQDNNLETLTVSSEADSYHLSPSTKRAVISVHGELFTIATDQGDVRRLTNTPGERETQPHWSPDGKWIAFLGDKTGREEVYLCDERGRKVKKLTDTDTQKSQLVWSPDSKNLLYTGSDRKLHKINLETGKSTAIAKGDAAGFGNFAIMNPQWSPDGKWVSYTRAGKNLLPHVYVIPADGGKDPDRNKEQRITRPEVYSDSDALWTADGKHIVYLVGGGDAGNIGQRGQSTSQLYIVSLLPEKKDPTDTNIDSEAEAGRSGSSGRGFGGRFGGGFGGDDGAAKVEVKIDFKHIGRRTRQLTRTPDAVGSVAVAPTGRTVVFVTSGVEGGRRVSSIWSVQTNGQRLTRVVQSGAGGDTEGRGRGRGIGGGFASLQFSRDGRALFYRQGSGIYTVSLGGGLGGGTTEASPVASGRGSGRGGRGFAAVTGTGTGSTGRRLTFTARVEIDENARRKQVFQESWRIMKHRFYDPEMHGVNWVKMKETYEPLLEHVGDQEELHDVVSQMIGELNASHTGIGGGFAGRGEFRGAQTRFPGFELEPDKSGYYKVSHIYRNGPADKDYVKLEVGDYVLAIDDQEVKVGDNYWKHYTMAPGTRLEFTVNSKPEPEGAWTVKVTPVSSAQYGALQYEKWVADRQAMVKRLSNDTVGYLHIRQMSEPSLRKFERDLTRLHHKKALIIDQRFNPGGGIDQELLQILGQRQYQYTKARDSIVVRRPFRGFFGPMVVMANERSTSDAEVFPDGFRTLKLGKVVGVTTYGAVIGTGGYQLMDGSVIRTPTVGLWNVSGQNLENYGVPPDVYVDNLPEDFFKGRDAQLEKAVEVLQEEMKKKK
jgi:tricorn protease